MRNKKTPKTLTAPFSERQVYDGIVHSIRQLSDTVPLEFNAVTNGLLAKSFKKAVETINTVRFVGTERRRACLLNRYLAWATGMIILLGMKLTTLNIINTVNRMHDKIMEGLKDELSYQR